MRSPVKNPRNPEAQLVAALARHLLSPSAQFEDRAQLARASMTDSLRVLAGLDKPTRLSLPILNAQAAQTASAPATPQPPSYGSARPDYRQALADTSVVDALIGLHQRKRAPTQSTLAASRAQNLGRTPAAAPPARTPIFRTREPIPPRVKPKI